MPIVEISSLDFPGAEGADVGRNLAFVVPAPASKIMLAPPGNEKRRVPAFMPGRATKK